MGASCLQCPHHGASKAITKLLDGDYDLKYDSTLEILGYMQLQMTSDAG